MSRQSNHRPPIRLDAATLQQMNSRYAVVFFSDNGIAYVVDTEDDSMMTYTQFKRKLGVIGEQFLRHPDKRVFFSASEFEQARAAGPDAA